MKFFLTLLIFIVACNISTIAQSKGYFSGNLMLNANFYQRDTIRGTVGPVYDNYLSGADMWLNLNYTKGDLQTGIRLDMYQNSILFNPTGSYSGQGIAMWFAEKQIDQLNLRGGYIYDQFGSGLIFRSYEARGLGIDNSLVGIRAKYELNNNIYLKALAGRQKNRFELYNPIIKGIGVDADFELTQHVQINPGAAVVNRTLDQESMNLIVNEINGQPLDARFIPKYNVYAYTIYNRLNYKNVSWYFEYAGKTNESVKNFDGSQLIDRTGAVYYTNFSYSIKGLGATVQYRKIESFPFRTSPNETLLNGMVNYLPTFSRQNTYRLISRYNAVAQELGESALQGDIIWSPTKKLTLNASFSDIRNDTGDLLWREVYLDAKIKHSKKLKSIIGVQHVLYNKEVYQGKGGMVEAITPFLETSYKIDRKKSIRVEVQYQYNQKDFGSWIYGLIEYNIAPHYSVSISDMYNYAPYRDAWKDKTELEIDAIDDAFKLHFYSFSGSYTKKSTKLTVSYVKQVEGVVCTGGICRFQPAFSGVMGSLLTSF